MPFDRFTVEQIAGDLLPGATPDQTVATGFHRNTMINEEGGIDVEEFRFASLVDRVATTGAAWLGLTVQCAQCHTHKYDPITQREYYQFLAFFNNADEPETFDVPDPAIAAGASRDLSARSSASKPTWPNEFPATDPDRGWEPLVPRRELHRQRRPHDPGPTARSSPPAPLPTGRSYTIEFDLDGQRIDAIRLEVLGDPKAAEFGPGRTPHGNFVLTKFSATIEPSTGGGPPVPIRFAMASADVSQREFAPGGVLDDDPRTGWAIDDGSGRLDKTRTAAFKIREGVRTARQRPDSRVVLDQQYGGVTRWADSGCPHVTRRKTSPRPSDDSHTAGAGISSEKFAEWEKALQPHRWSVLTPSRAVSKKNATMNVLADGSVLVTGDKPNNDVYKVDLPVGGDADHRDPAGSVDRSLALPDGGPGRAPLFSVGDFILTELELHASDAGRSDASRPVRLANASQDHAEAGQHGRSGDRRHARIGLDDHGGRRSAPCRRLRAGRAAGSRAGGARLSLTLHQFGIHQTTLGKFRVSITGDAAPVRASALPAEIEAASGRAEGGQVARTGAVFSSVISCSIAPETAPARARIDELRSDRCRDSRPRSSCRSGTPRHARTTHIHRRGEFLNLGEAVSPGVPAVLPPLPPDAPKSRLALARLARLEETSAGRAGSR